jgi:hypothetical protein
MRPLHRHMRPFDKCMRPSASVCTPQSAVCAPYVGICAPLTSVCAPPPVYAPHSLPYVPLTQAYAPLSQPYMPAATPTIQRGSDVAATMDKVSPDLPRPRSTRHWPLSNGHEPYRTWRTNGWMRRTHRQPCHLTRKYSSIFKHIWVYSRYFYLKIFREYVQYV